MKKIILAFCSLLVISLNVQAQTPAGTVIVNQATVRFEQGADDYTILSNPASFTVAELLDLTVIWNDSTSVPVSSPDTQRVLTFKVTNTGNAVETYTLVDNPIIGGGDFNPVVNTNVIYVENGNQVGFQISGANRDIEYTNGQTITLNPNQSKLVYLVYDIPANLTVNNKGYSQLTVKSNVPGIENLSTPGQSIPATSTHVEIVVGNSVGKAISQGYYEIFGVIAKSKKEVTQVKDVNGGNIIATGSELTYKITVTLEGIGVAKQLTITDIFPPELQYVTQSMVLNGIPLTDEVDADFGSYDTTKIQVLLGDQVAPKTFELVFKTIVK